MSGTPAARQDWARGIEQVRNESGGVLDVSIIDALAGADLMANAVLGDREAASLLVAVAQAAAQVKQAPRRRPALCICCPRPVKRISSATVFGVAAPSIASPSRAIGFVFCDKCAADRTTLVAKAGDGLRRIWPDLRPITITNPVRGRA